MDAWELLTAGSTIEDSDAWAHLNAQAGGGSGTYLILADGLEVELMSGEIEIDVEQSAVEVTVDVAGVEVEVNQGSVEVEL